MGNLFWLLVLVVFVRSGAGLDLRGRSEEVTFSAVVFGPSGERREFLLVDEVFLSDDEDLVIRTDVLCGGGTRRVKFGLYSALDDGSPGALLRSATDSGVALSGAASPSLGVGRYAYERDEAYVLVAETYDGAGPVQFRKEVSFSVFRQWPAVLLTVADSESGENFGRSVALSGTVSVVGSDLDDDGRGSAYVFEAAAESNWTRVAKLEPDDAATRNFGFAVAVAGGQTVVVATTRGGIAGAAYVFEKSPEGAWPRVATLTGDVSYAPVFGRTVSAFITGEATFIVVAAPFEDKEDLGIKGIYAGAVYVFRRHDSSASWVLDAKLWAADAQTYGLFGTALAGDGETIVVGASGGGTTKGDAYVFRRDAGGFWRQVAKLTAEDPVAVFAAAVAVTDDVAKGVTVAVGSPFASGDVTGRAFVYEKNTNTTKEDWPLVATLRATDATPFDEFGEALAMAGDTIVVGARQRGAGAAYVFKKKNQSWTQVAKLAPPNGLPRQQFGVDVAVHGHTVLVGSQPYAFDPRNFPLADDPSAAFLFDLSSLDD